MKLTNIAHKREIKLRRIEANSFNSPNKAETKPLKTLIGH